MEGVCPGWVSAGHFTATHQGLTRSCYGSERDRPAPFGAGRFITDWAVGEFPVSAEQIGYGIPAAPLPDERRQPEHP